MGKQKKNDNVLTYININNFFDVGTVEVKSALFFTIIVFIVIYNLKVYDNFSIYQDAFKNIFIYIASALIGVIGLVFASVALVFTALDEKLLVKIKKYYPEIKYEDIFDNFKFISFNIGMEIILFFLLYLILHSDKELVNYYYFYLLVSIITYLFLFTVFYIVSLMGYCILIFKIKYTFEKIQQIGKTIFEETNELKIDYLLTKYIELSERNGENVLYELYDFVKTSESKNKEDVLKYLDQVHKK